MLEIGVSVDVQDARLPSNFSMRKKKSIAVRKESTERGKQCLESMLDFFLVPPPPEFYSRKNSFEPQSLGNE